MLSPFNESADFSSRVFLACRGKIDTARIRRTVDAALASLNNKFSLTTNNLIFAAGESLGRRMPSDEGASSAAEKEKSFPLVRDPPPRSFFIASSASTLTSDFYRVSHSPSRSQLPGRKLRAIVRKFRDETLVPDPRFRGLSSWNKEGVPLSD